MPKFVQWDLIPKDKDWPMAPEVSVIWSMQRFNFKFFKVGIEFDCLFQKDLTVPGEDFMIKKRHTPTTLAKYYQRLK